jgi:hypothetical protein
MFTITLLSMAMALSLSVVVWRMVRDDRRRSEARICALTDLAVRPDLHASSASPAVSFAPPDRPAVWGTRAAIMVCLALGLTTVILMTLTARTRASIPTLPSNPAAQPSAALLPLQLLSLRDTREAGTLTIAGLVENPRGARALRDVKVTADAFDSKGTRIASGAAAVDVRTLEPGDQSPFVLSITTRNTVARYRVSFHTTDGRVVQHVDRRRQMSDAASW